MRSAARGEPVREDGALPDEASSVRGAVAAYPRGRSQPTLLGIGAEAVAAVQPLALPFSIGDVLGERHKYQVLSVIGAGEVAFVVEALDREAQQAVALKVLRPEFAAQPATAQRFLDEAQDNFKLRDEHLVRVYEVGLLADGAPFVAMERLRGTDLRALLDDVGALLIKRAVTLALHVCEGLATVHALGLVHRGLRPENLYVTCPGDRERLKLLEIGTCKHVVEDGAVALEPTAILTDPAWALYLAPELRAADAEVDARADIWALGCVLYELLTGRPPFYGARAEQAFTYAATVPMRALRARVPRALAAVVARCMAERPEDRFQDIAELANALVPFALPRAHEHAVRCAERLEHGPDRVSGVRRIEAELPLAPLLLVNPRAAPPQDSGRTTLALLLCVPILWVVGWWFALQPWPAPQPTSPAAPPALSGAQPASTRAAPPASGSMAVEQLPPDMAAAAGHEAAPATRTPGKRARAPRQSEAAERPLLDALQVGPHPFKPDPYGP